MSKKTLRKAYQKELALEMRTKRRRKDRTPDEDAGYGTQEPRNQEWGYGYDD